MQVIDLLGVTPTPHTCRIRSKKAFTRELPRHGHNEEGNWTLTLTRGAVCKQPFHGVLYDATILVPGKHMREMTRIRNPVEAVVFAFKLLFRL